jgi:hypothetical protein
MRATVREDLVETTTYTRWAIANPELIIDSDAA